MRRRLKLGWSLVHDVLWSIRSCCDAHSSMRLAGDFLLWYGNLFLPHPLSTRPSRGMSNQERTIVVKPGVKLTYRLNAGDLQSIREVWIDSVYDVSSAKRVAVVVDLGAHIGLTSLWLSVRYPDAVFIAVEPSHANAALLNANFSQNKINGHVMRAAISDWDGCGLFADAPQSNLGRLSQAGDAGVVVMSCESLLRMFQVDRVSVLKMDVEGAERNILLHSGSWLAQVDCIVAEFHPDVASCSDIIGHLSSYGLQRTPLPHSRHTPYVAAFTRDAGALS